MRGSRRQNLRFTELATITAASHQRSSEEPSPNCIDDRHGAISQVSDKRLVVVCKAIAFEQYRVKDDTYHREAREAKNGGQNSEYAFCNWSHIASDVQRSYAWLELASPECSLRFAWIFTLTDTKRPSDNRTPCCYCSNNTAKFRKTTQHAP
jgi:hypothetical protein